MSLYIQAPCLNTGFTQKCFLIQGRCSLVLVKTKSLFNKKNTSEQGKKWLAMRVCKRFINPDLSQYQYSSLQLLKTLI